MLGLGEVSRNLRFVVIANMGLRKLPKSLGAALLPTTRDSRRDCQVSGMSFCDEALSDPRCGDVERKSD